MPPTLRSSLWLLVPSIVVLVIAWKSLMSSVARRRSRKLLQLGGRELDGGRLHDAHDTEFVDAPVSSWLERWLYVSGFRGATALQVFILVQGAATLVGLGATLLVLQSGALETLKVWLDEVPGGPGILLLPVLSLAPWLRP